MPVTSLLLILGSALVHAAWNIMLKQQPSPARATTGISLWCAATAVAYGLVTIHQDPFPNRAAWGYSLLAGVFEAGYFYALGLAFEKASLSMAYTLSRGGAVVFVWPLAVLLQNEPLHWGSAAGALLVVCGLVMCGMQADGESSRSGLLAAMLSAFFIALNHVGYKQAILVGGQPSLVFAVSMMVATVLNVLLGRLYRRLQPEVATYNRMSDLNLLRSPRVVLIGALACLSFVLALEAMRTVGAASLLTLRNLSIPFTVVLSWGLGERPSRLRLAGSLAVTLGGYFLFKP